MVETTYQNFSAAQIKAVHATRTQRKVLTEKLKHARGTGDLVREQGCLRDLTLVEDKVSKLRTKLTPKRSSDSWRRLTIWIIFWR